MKKSQIEELIRKGELVIPDGHKFPTTRREFLAYGIMKFSAMIALPSIANVLAQTHLAQAATCIDAPNGGGLPPFITINLSGGATLGANFVPMNEGGELLSSYSKMGLGKTPNLEMAFGKVPFAGPVNGQVVSHILKGIREIAPASTLDRTAFVGVNVQSRDDFAENKLDASGMVIAAGRVGAKLPNLGRSGSSTGIRQLEANVKPPVPLVVTDYNDILGAAGGFSNTLARLSRDQQISLFKTIDRLSNSQSRKLASMSGGKNIQDLIECAGIRNNEIVSSTVDTLDPRKDNRGLSELWSLAGKTDKSIEMICSSMVFNVLNGNAPTASLELGGYDYHTGNRTTGNTKDLEAGRLIGRVLHSAALMNSKLFLYVTTDGANGSEDSNSSGSAWRSDRGTAGVNYMLAYDPAVRPETTHFQLGHFEEGQVASTQFPTGSLPERAAAGVFANYLKFSGQVNLIDKVIPRLFSRADLDKIILF